MSEYDKLPAERDLIKLSLEDSALEAKREAVIEAAKAAKATKDKYYSGTTRDYDDLQRWEELSEELDLAVEALQEVEGGA